MTLMGAMLWTNGIWTVKQCGKYSINGKSETGIKYNTVAAKRAADETHVLLLNYTNDKLTCFLM